MFETLKRLYSEGRLTETELTNAVTRGWITEEQKGVILDANTTSESRPVPHTVSYH